MRNLLIIFILLQGFPVTIYTRRIVMSRYRLNSLSSDAKEPRFEPNVSSTLRDVFSLSECALRSRLLSKRAFFYSMETMECELNPQSHVMYGASGRLDEYILVINKGISYTVELVLFNGIKLLLVYSIYMNISSRYTRSNHRKHDMKSNKCLFKHMFELKVHESWGSKEKSIV